MFASPTGLPTNDGTEGSPYDLATATTQSQVGKNVILKGGIYIYDSSIAFGIQTEPALPTVVYGEDGERPIITRSDNEAPDVRNGHNVTMYHVWLGGSSKTIAHTCQHGNDSKIVSCTLWNYFDQGLNEGASIHTFYKRNRFINCGSGTNYHGIYINNPNPANGEGAAIEENIFIKCGGYSIQIWNDADKPDYVYVRYNFFGDTIRSIALGCLNCIVDKNILWSDQGTCIFMANNSTFYLRKNVHGLGANVVVPNPPSLVITDKDIPDNANRFIGSKNQYGFNYVNWAEADVQSNLGNSSANINAAISALETAFTQTTQQIHDDATIETHFTTLKSVIDTWKAQP